jgi:putative tryptophan/tyrosine transport system substrate-binding protein
MRRREFIGLVSGAAVARPFTARAQQPERVRRIAMLSEFSEPQMQPLIAAFRQQLQQLGWKDDSFRIDLRVAIADAAQFQIAGAAVVGGSPDVIVALGSRAVQALQRETRTIPVVFALVAEPVAQGFVDSLARPGGNVTGLTNFEFSFAGKWLEALKEIEPRISRVLLMVNPGNSGASGLARFVEGIGPSYGVEMMTATVRTAAEIEAAVTDFGSGPDQAIIVLPDGLVVSNRELLIRLVNRSGIPVVFPFRIFTVDGGLLSWGLDFSGVYRQAATYVDRILRGSDPKDLPVQAPTKFELVINLKTAKALALKIPPTLLALADEVIE